MENRTKGTLAAAAATAMLLGGAGSLAYWSDQADVGGGPITAGELALAAAPGQWYDLSRNPGPDAPGTLIADPSSFLIVPGDIIEYRATATITAKGDHLVASLKASTQTITPDNELKQALITTVTTNGSGSGTSKITEADNGKSVGVNVRVTFDPATAQQTAQGQTVNLDKLKLTLTQDPR